MGDLKTTAITKLAQLWDNAIALHNNSSYGGHTEANDPTGHRCILLYNLSAISGFSFSCLKEEVF